MGWFAKFFAAFNAIVSDPALLLGLLSVIGMIALRQKWTKVLSSFIKTVLGYLILSAGVSLISTTFTPIITGIKTVLGVEGYIIEPSMMIPVLMTKGQELLPQLMSWASYVMVLAILLNIVYVIFNKYTKIRAIYSSGHIVFLGAIYLTFLIWWYFDLSMWATIGITAVLLSLWMGIASSSNIAITDKVTGGAGFTIAHNQHLMNWLAAKLGPLFGDPEKDDIDKLKFPGWLSIFSDNVVGVPLVMLLFMGPIIIALGPQVLNFDTYSLKYFIAWFKTIMQFGVYMVIIFTGVRMFVGELTSSFRGISEKLIPGAVIGIDGMAVATFSPNAVVGGFIVCGITEILGMLFLVLIKSPILIIPGFTPMFFDAAIVSVFANKFGGWKAVVIMAVLTGLVHIFGNLWMVSLQGPLVGASLGMSDWGTVCPAVFSLIKLISPIR